MIDRTQLENRALAEMLSFSAAPHDYGDVVQAVLDLLDEAAAAVSSGSIGFVGLSLQEPGHVAQYARVDRDVDSHWAEEVGRHIAEVQGSRLAETAPLAQLGGAYCLLSPAAWLLSLSQETRSGRVGVLTLASPRPLELTMEDERVLEHLLAQALLLLDHAILLDQMESLEVIDPLTGIANYRRVLDVLDYELRRHRHSGRSLALALLDIEGLAAINRSYGRQYGNHILRKLAGLLAGAVRPVDTVARCGLDEFAVLLPETDEDEGRELAEELRQEILAAPFAGGAIGVSLGVARVKPDESLSVESVLRRAEQALQEAKRQDRELDALTRMRGQTR